MKNTDWRRIAMILGLVVAGGITYGVGYSMGSLRTAEFMIDQVARIMNYEGITINISRVELFEYFLKLKGGI